MARRHHQVGRYVASETKPDGVGQRKLEEVDETGIGHLRALSPWLLTMMMTHNATPVRGPQCARDSEKTRLSLGRPQLEAPSESWEKGASIHRGQSKQKHDIWSPLYWPMGQTVQVEFIKY